MNIEKKTVNCTKCHRPYRIPVGRGNFRAVCPFCLTPYVYPAPSSGKFPATEETVTIKEEPVSKETSNTGEKAKKRTSQHKDTSEKETNKEKSGKSRKNDTAEGGLQDETQNKGKKKKESKSSPENDVLSSIQPDAVSNHESVTANKAPTPRSNSTEYSVQGPFLEPAPLVIRAKSTPSQKEPSTDSDNQANTKNASPKKKVWLILMFFGALILIACGVYWILQLR